MNPYIPYGRQSLDEDDIKAVVDVLRSDWITQGPMIERFEKKVAEYCGAKYAVAVSSGTAALHAACFAASIKKGDEAITSPNTFVASANCIIYQKGTPVFADIESESLNIDPKEIKRKLTPNTKAIIPVHFAGLPCKMEEISNIAKSQNLTVIEDACHALGAEYQDSTGKWKRVGSCKHSDMTVFSFHPVKHITTGEGGMVLTNHSELFERLRLFRTHGITKDPNRMNQNDGEWYYEMRELGGNYRITDFQSALGIQQLEKLDGFLSQRKRIAKQYNEAFRASPFIGIPPDSPDSRHAWHIYPIRLKTESLKSRRKLLFSRLREKNIGVQVHYIPVHTHPFYQRAFGYKYGDFPVSEKYYEQTLTLPLYPGMSDNTVRSIIEAVQSEV